MFTKAVLKRIISKEKEDIYMQMEISTLVNSLTTKKKEKGK